MSKRVHAAGIAALVAGLTLAAGAGADDARAVRAAVPAGAIEHVLVINLENEGYATTFGPGSPATYLNTTLLAAGELVPNWFGTSRARSTRHACCSCRRPNRR